MILQFLAFDSLTGNQFSDYVVRQFSNPEMHSEFVAIGSLKNLPEKVYNLKRVRVVDPSSEAFESLLSSLANYHAIVLHGLFYPWCERVLKSVPEKVKVAWMFWGGEIYGRKDLADRFLAPRTRFVYHFKQIKDRLYGKQETQYELPLNLYKRIDYCLTDMEEEYAFAKEYTGASRMQFHWYNYYSINETLGKLRDCQCAGSNVFLGNSATIECNYFDVLPKLSQILPAKSKVFIPLSYGAGWVRNLVVKHGEHLFGKRVVMLTDFLPRDEYNELMLSCSTMIQPHYRAQAQGNIITALWLGMRVYLSEKNFAYRYFKRIGAAVFSLEKDFSKDSFSVLPEETVARNRTVMLQWYDRVAMRERNLKLVDLLEGIDVQAARMSIGKSDEE